MSLVAWIAVSVLLFAIYIIWYPAHRGLPQSELALIFRNMTVRLDNGGLVKVSVPRTKVWFSVVRAAGDEKKARLEFCLPYNVIGESGVEKFRESITLSGYEWANTKDDLSKIAVIGLDIVDIYNPTSYSKLVMIVRRFFQLCDVPVERKMNIAEFGRRRFWRPP